MNKETHNKRLEEIINSMIVVANDYALEGNLADCMLITQKAGELYKTFDDKYQLENEELKYKLALTHTKLATLETLQELQRHNYLPTMHEYEYEQKFLKKINDFYNIVLSRFAIFFAKLNGEPIPHLLATILKTNISDELKEQYKEWFDYVNVIKKYFGTFTPKGQKLTPEEEEILERFKSKYRDPSVQTQLLPDRKTLPEIIPNS